MRIAIDAMGGDHAPQAIVDGVLRAAAERADVEFVLVGDETALVALGATWPRNVRIRHAPEVIGPDEEPVRAIRQKKHSSLVTAVKMVNEREADACISAGNTGAYMAAALLYVGRIPGIERPALAPVFPTTGSWGVLVLDVGANVDARPQHLLQYAVMGSVYVSSVEGVNNPRVGLLNIGTEATKGNELTKAAYALLEQANLNFIGNVEARDVLAGVADVVVCDGFNGNVLLKAAEGTAETIFRVLQEELTGRWTHKLAAALLRPAFRRLKARMDYKEHGGAPLLGINGPCIKAHGSSDARAIHNAVRQAIAFVERDVLSSISRQLG
ncbi:MAG: phosphate acyltransferase PlsX [Calditerricola sp.]|nr:phosphate acyltransferase PlsX [Calditerricola sp.]